WHRGGFGRHLRLVVSLPHQQHRPAPAIRQRRHAGLVVPRPRDVEIDLREAATLVAIVRERAAGPRRDQQVLVTVAVHVVPGDAGPELTQRLRHERLSCPVVVRGLDVAVPELRRDIAEPRGWRPGTGGWGGDQGGLWLVDLILAIRTHGRYDRPPSSTPVDLDRQVLRLPGGERVERVGPREVWPAEHDVLHLLGNRLAPHADVRARTRRVGGTPAQPHCHARRTGEIAIHGRRRAEP